MKTQKNTATEDRKPWPVGTVLFREHFTPYSGFSRRWCVVIGYDDKKNQYRILFEDLKVDWVPKYPQEKLAPFDVNKLLEYSEHFKERW